MPLRNKLKYIKIMKTDIGRKTTVWIFQVTYWRHGTQEDSDMVNFEEETDSLLTAARNNAINTIYIKTKTGTT